MKLAELRRLVNNSYIGRRVNESLIPIVTGTMLECLSGARIAYSPDEFLDMIAYVKSPAVVAELRTREGGKSEVYSARYRALTADGTPIIYDEQIGRYRTDVLEPSVSTSTLEKRTEAAVNALLQIADRLATIKERLPYIRTEIVNKHGLKLDGVLYEMFLSSARKAA